MKLNVHHRNIKTPAAVDRLVTEKLQSLAQRRRIDEARVEVEDRRESSPRFWAQAHLVTPGPDLKAGASDHSLAAALQKLEDQLHAQLDRRERHRAGRPGIPRQGPPLRRTVMASRR